MRKTNTFQKTVILVICLYRELFGRNKFFAVLFPFSCRYYPSCSEFTQEAIIKYGIKKGACIAVKRLFRCMPIIGKSGYDPVK